MSERVPLSFAIAEASDRGQELICDEDHPITVSYDGVPWVCRAVLERTAILVSTVDEHDRRPVRIENVHVDPVGLTWKDVKKRGTWNGPVAPAELEERNRARRQSDKRARENQAEVARQNAAEDAREARRLQREREEHAKETTAPIAAVSAPSQPVVLSHATPPQEEVVMPQVMKHCPSCKQDKPKSEFPPGKGFFYCNACRAARVPEAPRTYTPTAENAQPGRRGHVVDGELSKPAEGMKFCPHCEKEKPLEEFGLNKRKADGHQSICKSCRSAIWTAGSTTMGHVKKAAEGDAASQLKVLINGLRVMIHDLRAENERLKNELAGVNAQLEELLAV